MCDYSIKALSQIWIDRLKAVTKKTKANNTDQNNHNPDKVNLLGGDGSLNSGLAICRLQVPETSQKDNTVLIICGRDAEFSDETYKSYLDEQDLEAFRNIRNKMVKQKVMAGKVLRRIALTMASNGKVQEKDWKFDKNENGKPFIKSHLPEYHFNITHCNGATFVAVSEQHKLGIDAEMVDGMVADSFIEDVLSKEERSTLGKLPENERKSKFFEFWTLKEAYTKLIGTGLTVNLKQIAFELNPPRVNAWKQDLATRFLTWKTLNGSSFCQVAVALG